MPSPRAAAPDRIIRSFGRLPEEIPALFWKEQWRALRGRWRTLSVCVAAGLILGVAVAALETTLYHAQATLEIQPAEAGLPAINQGEGGIDAELMDLQTQIRILESASLTARVRRRLEHRNGIDPKVLEGAVKSLAVHSAGPTRIVEIETTAKDPVVAAAFVNAIAQEFIARHAEARAQAMGSATERLRHAIAEMRVKLERDDDAVQTYARQSGIVITADRNSLAEEKLREIQDALTRAHTDRIEKDARRRAALLVDEHNLAAVLNEPAVKGAEEKLADLRRQRAELSVTYTPEYPKVQRLSAQIGAMEAYLSQQVRGAANRLASELSQAERREDMLAQSYRIQQQALALEAERRVHYDVLKSEADATCALYNTMLTRVNEAGITSAMRGSSVRILDPATPAQSPVQPRPARALLLGGLAGFLFGAFAVHNKGPRSPAIRKPGELWATLGVPEFGAAPANARVAARDEAYRSIVASLILSEGGNGPRVLVIASAQAGEGKTTVTANLGRALARAGKRVLLIDGDLRGSQLTGQLDLSGRAGLADLLGRPTALDVFAIAPLILEAGPRHLYALAAGNATENTPDLLPGDRLAEVLAYARNNFDIVLIDTPPALEISDARFIGRAADAAILVARAGVTTRESAMNAHRKLAEAGIQMTGSVLNGWNERPSPGGQKRVGSALRPQSEPVSKQASA